MPRGPLGLNRPFTESGLRIQIKLHMVGYGDMNILDRAADKWLDSSTELVKVNPAEDEIEFKFKGGRAQMEDIDAVIKLVEDQLGEKIVTYTIIAE